MEAVREEVGLVSLTDMAAIKLRGLLQEKGLTDHGLRVFVQGGGCSGLQYGMAFENQTVEGDTIVESGGMKVYVDHISAMYLAGSSIDFVDSIMGGGFKIDNPNAVASCGCGQSFKTSGGNGGDGGGCSGCG